MTVFKGLIHQIIEIHLFTQQSADGKAGEINSALIKPRSPWFKLWNELRLCGDLTPDTAFKHTTGQINGKEHMQTCK